jgi:hypothetical protein
MPIEKKPLTLARRKPDAGGWYKSHKVKDGDNWWSLAAEHNVDVWQLIHFNFATYDPDEVNWYLRHYVCCKVHTPDGKNWRFSSNANPGIVYIPVRPVSLGPVSRAQSEATAKLQRRHRELKQEIERATVLVKTAQQAAAQEGSRLYERDSAGKTFKAIDDLSKMAEKMSKGHTPGEAALDNYIRSKNLRELESLAQQREATLKRLREELREVEALLGIGRR